MDFIKKRDKQVNGKPIPKWMISGGFSFLAFMLSMMYATDAGLFFLDAVDFYINFVLLLIGFFETFSAGWVYGIEAQIETLGPTIVFAYMFSNFGAVVVACGLWFGLDDNAVGFGFLGGFLSYAVGIGATAALMSQKMEQEPEKGWTWKTMAYEVGLSNVFQLREELEAVVGFTPRIWAFFMKQIIPHILLVLFINLAQSKNEDGESLFGNYGNLATWPYQVLGILLVVFVACLILVGMALPSVFEGADLTVGRALGEVSVRPDESAKDSLHKDPTSTTPGGLEEDSLEEVEA